MQTCRYAAIQVGSEWWVDADGRSFGPKQSQDVAVLFAQSLAALHSPPDRRCEVWARDEAGLPVLQWCGSGLGQPRGI